MGTAEPGVVVLGDEAEGCTEADAGTGGGAEKSPIAPLNLGPQNPPPTAAPWVR